MAITIVNRLNDLLGPNLDLPSNSCHVHIDLEQLTAFVLERMRAGTLPTLITPPAHVPRSGREGNEEVVIVGQAMRLPEHLNSPEALWDALLERRDDLLTSVPSDRWDQSSFYHPPPSSGEPPRPPGDIHFNRAGFVDLDSFDHAFFGITEPEALMISPTVRLPMEVTLDALEDANIPLGNVRGSDMAVFVATGPDEGYNQLIFLEHGFDGWRFSVSCTLKRWLMVYGYQLTIDSAARGLRTAPRVAG